MLITVNVSSSKFDGVTVYSVHMIRGDVIGTGVLDIIGVTLLRQFGVIACAIFNAFGVSISMFDGLASVNNTRRIGVNGIDKRLFRSSNFRLILLAMGLENFDYEKMTDEFIELFAILMLNLLQ